MKATGIVRRIDELGRVVIPKEIRRTLRIREGDPLEIFTDHDGEVVLKKYSPIGEIAAIAKDYTDSLYRSLGHIACISDRDAIVSASGAPKRDMLEKPLSAEIEAVLQGRQTVVNSMADGGKLVPITNDDAGAGYTAQVIAPIIADGEIIGGLILLSLGVIGEYIGKIYGEVKDRPRYIIEAVTLDPGSEPETKNQRSVV